MAIDRSQYIGGSDAGAIMRGDWHELWLKKTNRIEPEDLSDVFKVQLGIFTEDFNRSWASDKIKVSIDNTQTFKQHGISGGTVDGLTDDNGIIECKHVSAFYKEENLLKFYYPQCQHYLYLYPERTHIYLSVIKGNDWSYFKLERNEPYIHDLIDSEETFWKTHVEKDEEPVETYMESLMENEWDEKLSKIVKEIPVNGMRSINMESSNTWTHNAETWLKRKEAHTEFINAEKELKSIVKPQHDVRKAFGHGIEITRDKRGSLRIKEMNNE